MYEKIRNYIKETKIDERLAKPFDKYYSDRLEEECKITYFTLKELQELYYFRERHNNYSMYFFKNIDSFFKENIKYRTEKVDLLFVVNSYDTRGLYYSIGLFYF